MKLLYFLLSGCCLSCTIKAQSYNDYIKKADSLMIAKQYAIAARYYDNAFRINGGKAYPDDRYNAAVAHVQNNNIDTVLLYITILKDRIGFSDIEKIKHEKAFDFLANNVEWIKLCEAIVENSRKINRDLMVYLEEIYDADQSVRKVENFKQQEYTDSINLIKIEYFLQKYGWLGADVVGYKGNQALFLVLQHSELPTQEKYLPMIRQAVKEGKALPTQLALFEDRVLMGQGKPQIYGSQIKCTHYYENQKKTCYVYPIEHPQDVDKRRAAIGLNPIAEYVKVFGLEWNLQEHIEQSKFYKY